VYSRRLFRDNEPSEGQPKHNAYIEAFLAKLRAIHRCRKPPNPATRCRSRGDAVVARSCAQGIDGARDPTRLVHCERGARRDQEYSATYLTPRSTMSEMATSGAHLSRWMCLQAMGIRPAGGAASAVQALSAIHASVRCISSAQGGAGSIQKNAPLSATH